jgi:peptidoglycan-N-acetylglucosamine deacetylase
LAQRLVAVSVDVDGVDQYLAIHGLSHGALVDRDAVQHCGVVRLAAWADRLGLPLTWFIVGRDLERPAFADWCRGRREHGDELASHSLDHLYDLTLRSPDEQHRQLAESFARIGALSGDGPIGFRAPGYTVTDHLLAQLQELGAAYDSSTFACPWYYAAKVVVLGGMRLLGRRSHSVLDTPRILASPIRPYRVGCPYHRPGRGLLELPIQVTPFSRLPYIGTTLGLVGPTGARLLSRELAGEPFINLELHGLDALDRHDGLAPLASVQRDLRVAHQRKLDAFTAAIEVLLGRGYTAVRLSDAARVIGGSLAEGVWAG